MSKSQKLIAKYNLTTVGNIILRDLAYLDSPFWVEEELKRDGYKVEEFNIVPLDIIVGSFEPTLSVKIDGMEFGGRSLL